MPAILPVRFGTLLEADHLDEATRERDDEIAEAFDVVRDRVQFTWRIKGDRADRGSAIVTPELERRRKVGTEANGAIRPTVFRC